MKAAVRVAPKTIELEEWAPPEEEPTKVPVHIAYAGICGGDLMYFRHQGPVHAQSDAYVVCHEAVGHTLDGRRVVIDPLLACGTCAACLAGEEQWCPSRRDMGYSAHGVAREVVAMAPDRIHPVPDALSDTAATLAHGLAAVMHALDKVSTGPDTEAVVLGPGPAGMFFALQLRANGANVTLVGRESPRLALARSLGLSVVSLQTADAAWRNLAGEFDVAIETTGSSSIQAQAPTVLRTGGVLLLYAPGEFNLDANVVFRRELQIVGSTGATGKIPAALSAIADRVAEFDALVSHVFPFDRVQEAFTQAIAPPDERGDFMKALIAVEP